MIMSMLRIHQILYNLKVDKIVKFLNFIFKKFKVIHFGSNKFSAHKVIKTYSFEMNIIENRKEVLMLIQNIRGH
jgi:hypothetical protein